METLILDSDPSQLERLGEFVDSFCDRHQVAEESRYHLHVSLEELVLNAMKHGHCDPAKDAIRVGMRMDGGNIRIEIFDTGVPFNPLDAPQPDLGANIAERPVGGLGIHLVRCLMSDIVYERKENRNHLCLTKAAKK